MAIIPYIFVVIHMSAVVLASKRNKWCNILFLIGAIYWTGYNLNAGDIPQVIQRGFTVIMTSYGFYKWSKLEKEEDEYHKTHTKETTQNN